MSCLKFNQFGKLICRNTRISIHNIMYTNIKPVQDIFDIHRAMNKQSMKPHYTQLSGTFEFIRRSLISSLIDLAACFDIIDEFIR